MRAEPNTRAAGTGDTGPWFIACGGAQNHRLTSREPREGHCWIRTQWYPARGVWAVAVAVRPAGVHHRQCEVVVAVRAFGLGHNTEARRSPEPSQPADGGGVMSHIAAFPHSAGHRYSWCPSCDELWVTEWMAAEGVHRCPLCDGRVLAYVGRSPYDMPRGRADDPPRPAAGHGRETDGSAPPRRSIPEGVRLVVRDGLRVS